MINTIESDVMPVLISDELMDEAIEILGDFVLNEDPVEEFVEALMEANKDLLTEANSVSLHEIEMREKLMKAASMFLIGKPWLKDTDGWLDEIYEEFEADVQKAYDEWVDKNVEL